MKITRQPRRDRLASGSTAQMQLTNWWKDNRLRLGAGATGKPLADRP